MAIKPNKTLSPSVEALPARWSADMIRALGVFNLLRFGLGTALLVMIHFNTGKTTLGLDNPKLFLAAAIILLISSLLYFTWSNSSRKVFNIMTFTQFIIDMCCMVMLIHSSGGVSSSIPLLMLVNVAAGAVVMRYSYGLSIAIIGIILLAGEHFYSTFTLDQASNFQRLGIICFAILMTSLFISAISHRARLAEAKSDRQNESILALSAVNSALVQDLDIGIIVVDKSGHIEIANSAALDLLGHEDITDDSTINEVHPDLDHRYKIWREGKSESIVQIYNKVNGNGIHLEFERFGLKNTLTKITISSRRDVQDKAHNMTLAAMGRMATGIAHEVRNPLMIISSASELLANKRYSTPDDKKAIRMIDDNCERINNLIEEILNVGRNSEAHAEEIDLLKWLKSFLFNYCSYGNIPFSHIKLYCEQMTIRFSVQHLHQVTTNLCDNAFKYAKPSEEAPLKVIAREYKNRYVIDFISPGEKIREDRAEKIFEPFFSTGKKKGGTGLGLYLCKEICSLNMAKLNYIKTQEEGNCFRITIQRSANHDLAHSFTESTIA